VIFFFSSFFPSRVLLSLSRFLSDVFMNINRTDPTDDDGKSLADCGVVDGATLSMIKQRSVEVVTASADETAKIWNPFNGRPMDPFKVSNYI